MRKLVFMLRTNVPNGPMGANKIKNVEITTHRGARLLIKGNIAEVLDVTNDEMTDGELLTWYRSRYSGLGMGISILHDGETKTESVNSPEKTEKTLLVEPVEIKEELLKSTEQQRVVKVEPKIKSGTKLDEMSYFDMVRFAKDKGISVEGRGKECYVSALTEWFKTHD